MLLKWVVCYPATWLKAREVSLSKDRYKVILEGILMDALRFGNTGSITYLPAYLGKVVQTHFDVHGDEIYDEAKSIRTLAEKAISVAGQVVGRPAPDPVMELAAAARLLKPKTTCRKPSVKGQLNLL